MPAYLSPLFNEPQSDANGNPLSGGKIFTYVGGSVSTPAATYTSSTGTVPQANPIILNSRGVPDNPIWLTGGAAYKFVLQDANGNTLAPTFDNVQGINDPAAVSSQSEWTPLAATPTFLTATTFSVPGDQTGTLQPGRRLRTSNSGGVLFSTIFSAVFTTVTTVTVVNDGASLDSGLSSVSYSILSATNPSVPQVQYPEPNNRIINGACLVSQYGPTAIGNTSPVYGGCDRIGVVVSATTATGTLQQASPAVSGMGTYGKVQSATMTTSGTTSMQWFTRMEGKHVQDMGGRSVIFACKVYQNTGGALVFSAGLSKANTLDNFSAATSVLSGSGISVPSGVATTVYVRGTLNPGDADNGLQLSVNVSAFGAVTSKRFDISDLYFGIGSSLQEYFIQPQNVTTETLRCQRYYWPAPASSTGCMVTTTGALFPFTPPVPMRTTPTFTAHDTTSRFQISGGAFAIAGTWAFDTGIGLGVSATFTRGTGTWTAGQAIVLTYNTASDFPFSLSAEL